MLLLDQASIIASLCVSHDCINIPLQKSKFHDLIPFIKRKEKESSWS